MKQIMLVEDHPLIREGLVEILKTIDPHMRIYEFESAREAYDWAKTHEIDAFFLDVELKDLDVNGLWLAGKLREMECYMFTPIVFITGMADYKVSGFVDYRCFDYLIKPFDEEDVRKVFEKVIRIGIPERTSPVVDFYEKGIEYTIKEEEVIYLEYYRRTLKIYTKKDTYEFHYYPLSKALEMFSEGFARIHKSYAVNLDMVDYVDYTNSLVKMKAMKEPLVLGRQYKDNLRSAKL